MVPQIVKIGAAAGVVALALAIGTFFMPFPLWLKAFLYLLFGGLFLVSVVIFGRILVAEDMD